MGTSLSASRLHPRNQASTRLAYLAYYDKTRTHLSLDKDAPISRAIETAGRIVGCPVLGALHHQYVRI
jgi:hypothetical protein